MDTPELIMQACGVLGLVGLILGYQLKNKTATLVVVGIAQILFTVHYGLLGAWTGVAVSIYALSRSVIMILEQHDKADEKSWLFSSAVILLVLAPFYYEGWVTWLPIASMFIMTVALYQKNLQVFRVTEILKSPLWIIYGIVMGSWQTVGAEVLKVVSAGVGLLRFRKEKRKRRLDAKQGNIR